MLEDITFIDANPTPIVVSTTESDLSQCAFVFASNIDNLLWSAAEAKAIGDWLRKGGFLWTDGFWNNKGWEHWNLQLRKALPEAYVQELHSHPIFEYPFGVELQQPCRHGGWVKNFAVEDEKDRLMVLMTFNQRNVYGTQCGFVGDAWQGFAKNWQNEHSSWNFSINVFLHIMTNASSCDDASNGGIRNECFSIPF